jgi:hypothetical protein
MGSISQTKITYLSLEFWLRSPSDRCEDVRTNALVISYPADEELTLEFSYLSWPPYVLYQSRDDVVRGGA